MKKEILAPIIIAVDTTKNPKISPTR